MEFVANSRLGPITYIAMYATDAVQSIFNLIRMGQFFPFEDNELSSLKNHINLTVNSS